MTTVLFAVIGAIMVFVGVLAYLQTARQAAAMREAASAQTAVTSVLAHYEAQLGKNPYYFLDQVDTYERARRCINGPVARTYQPGEAWPAECGSTWVYVDPEGEPTREWRARIEVSPPQKNQPYLSVKAVAVSGPTAVAEERSYSQDTAASAIVTTDSDLVLGMATGSVDLVGDIYSGGKIYLHADNSFSIREGLVMAEGGFFPASEAVRTPTVRFFQPGGSGDIGDIRGPAPTPREVSELADEVGRLESVACDVASGEAGVSLCLRRGEKVTPVGGTPHQAITVPEEVEAFLLEFGHRDTADGKEQVVHVSWTRRGLGFVWDCAIRCSLRDLAATEVEAGTHMGSDDKGSAPSSGEYWVTLGTFPVPTSGVIFSDRDVSVGLCGDGFLTVDGPDCNVSQVSESVTVVAGRPHSPANIIIGGPIDAVSVDGDTIVRSEPADADGRLGLVATAQVLIPYWSHKPASGNEIPAASDNLEVDAALLALGRGEDLAGGRFGGAISTLPVRVHTDHDGNQGARLTVTGAIAGEGVDLTSNMFSDGMELRWDRRMLVSPPPLFPSYDGLWRLRSSVEPTALEVCGANCATWVGELPAD